MTLAAMLVFSFCGAVPDHSAQAPEVAPVDFADQLQQLWKASDNNRKGFRDRVVQRLDTQCRLQVERGESGAETKAKLEAFYRYDDRLSIMCAVQSAPDTWAVLYNLSCYGTGDYSPLLNVFTLREGKAVKMLAVWLKDARLLDAPHAQIDVITDSKSSGSYLLVSGATRVKSYFAVLAFDLKARNLQVVGNKEFSQNFPGGPGNKIVVADSAVVATYPEEAQGIMNGPLLWEERFAVENGRLVSRGRKILNPWYETVVEAVRLQKGGDREKFDAVCADRKLWDLLAGSRGLACEKQEAAGDASAVVVLRLAREREEDDSTLTLRLEKKETGWIIAKAEERKPED